MAQKSKKGKKEKMEIGGKSIIALGLMALVVAGVIITVMLPDEGDKPPITGVPPDTTWAYSATPNLKMYYDKYSPGATPTEISTNARIYCFPTDPRTMPAIRTSYSKKDTIYDQIKFGKYLDGSSAISYTSGGVNVINGTTATASSILCGWINGEKLQKTGGKYHFYILVWDSAALNSNTTGGTPQSFYYSVIEMKEDEHFWKLEADATAGQEAYHVIHDTDDQAIKKVVSLTIGSVSTTATTLTWAFTWDTTAGEVWHESGTPKVRLHLTLASGMTYSTATYGTSPLVFSPLATDQQYFCDLDTCQYGSLEITFSGTYAAGSTIKVYIEPEDGTNNPVSYTYNSVDPYQCTVQSMIGYQTG